MQKRKCFDILFISDQGASPEGIMINLQQLKKYHAM